jgi:hypothetical protein
MLIAPPPLHTHLPGVPAKVEEVVMRALAKDPQERFATVQEFANTLQQAYELSVSPSIRTDLLRVPAKVEEVIIGAFAKDPQERFATVQGFATALLQAYQSSAPPSLTPDEVIHKKQRSGKRAIASVLIALMLLVSLVSAGLFTGILRLSPGPHSCVGFSDKFQQNNFDGWTWINPANESKYTIEANPQDAQTKVLHIDSPGMPPYEDLNPEKTANLNAPRLVQPVDGDFTIETQVDFISQVNGYQGVGLVIWQNADNFLRLEVSAWKDQGYGVNFVHYDTNDPKGAFHDNGGKISVAEVTTKLRVERRGNVYTASWQQYNSSWTPITKTFTMSPDRVQAGLLLMNTQAVPNTGPVSPADGYFHYFHYTCNNT